MSIEPNPAIVTNGQLLVSIARIEERISNMADDVRGLENVIETLVNGSGGRPGLMERIALSEQAIVGLGARISTVEIRERESAKVPMKVILALIGIITTLAGAAATAITHLAG